MASSWKPSSSFPARIKQALTQVAGRPPALIDDREVLVVQGTTAGGATATLCFDAKTGCSCVWCAFSESPVGRLVTRVDYDDYRDVAGVKMPVSLDGELAERAVRRSS